MTKRVLAMVLAVVMVLSLVPEGILPVAKALSPAAADSAVMENTNQSDGVVLSKYAIAHTENGVPDGTIDIFLQAHTEGRVVKHSAAVPTDIVLVLDLSGSMDDSQQNTYVTGYETVYAEENHMEFWGYTIYYHVGLETNSTRYVKIDDNYIAATRSSDDSNGFEVWQYNSGSGMVNVYPALANGETTERTRQHSYPVVQMYRQTATTIQGQAKIDILKQAVDAFIDSTAESNSGISNASDKHRIALIKFGTADYYNDNNLIAEGDHKNSNNYNYTEVVKNFTTVDAGGATALKNAMDALEPGGATAVDYGINLAIQLFDAQDEQTESERNKVVIVFTDGSPTHSSNYESNVAGASINHANTLKDEGVTVYTLSVENGADGTQLGSSDSNRFMHYVSSNYPDAAYSNGNITAGNGSPESGYYLTPSTSNSLEMLFAAISGEIGSPTITMGSESHLIDTVSEYFTVNGGVNGVKVYTSLRNADGSWEDLVEDSSLIPVVNGNSVWVKGFGFDEHFISAEPRQVNGQDYYGKALVLGINVTPDYSAIDADGAVFGTTGNAFIETNHGNAQLTSGYDVVAQVASPSIPVNTVTYVVDGQHYNTVYRFAGTEVFVAANPTKAGSTFSGWKINGADAGTSFTMPEADVVIEGTFTKTPYTVSYQYVGAEIAGRPQLPASEIKFSGDSVTVAAKPTLVGYDFVGWYPQDAALGTGSITTFTMPAHNVVLLGRFVAKNDVAYKVEHYTENLDGSWKLEETENLSGKTGANVTAVDKIYAGFTFNDGIEGTVKSGVIAGDGGLILKLYYTRNEYEVTYTYTGYVPDSATPATLDSYTAKFKFEEAVTVENAAIATGYEFHGWHYANNTDHDIVTAFTMPANDVHLVGHFIRTTDPDYTVEHYFEKLDGTYPDTPNKVQSLKAANGTTVTAERLYESGYTLDPGAPGTVQSGTVSDSVPLVLKLYYKITRYNVSYAYTFAPQGTAVPSAHINVVPGTTVDVQSAPVVSGYTFSGWKINGADAGSSFTMPQSNVTLTGHYTINGYGYTVEHYIETDSGYELYAPAEIRQATHGAEITVSAMDIHGYSLNETKTQSENSGKTLESGVLKATVVDGTAIFAFYYGRQEYTVSYEITGSVRPDGIVLPGDCTIPFGKSAEVADTFNIPGYTFSGWTTEDAVVNAGSFTMPANDVKFVGSFSTTAVGYTVKYWQQSLDNSGTEWNGKKYTEVVSDRYTATNGVVGHYVNAYTDHYKEYAGFVLSDANNQYAGIIEGDSSLVLNLYYDRLTFSINYHYAGTQPDDAPDIPASYNRTGVPVGTVITIEAKMADCSEHIFDGWHGANIDIVGKTEFVMPAHDVNIYGRYNPVAPAGYTVTYYVDGAVHHTETVRPGQVHDLIESPAKANHVFTGWTEIINTATRQPITADSNFIMPWADVEIRGTFTQAYRPTQLLLTKSISAPDGFNMVRRFTFDIYDINDLTTPIITTTVYGGSMNVINMEPGTYKLVERDAHIDGYKHEYSCTAEDGIFRIEKGEYTRVTATNTYTEVALEKTNHFAYIVGYPDGTVQPDSNITRAEVATIFFRMLTDGSRQRVWSKTNDFIDVNADDWYNIAVSTLKNAEILFDEESFRPNDAITRAELVVVATAFYDSEVGDECAFSDIEGHWAEKFINEAYSLGIIDGYPDGTFRPDDFITRAETIAVVNRTLERHPDAENLMDGMIEWPDNQDKSAWYYAHIQEATNSHDYIMMMGTEVWLDLTPIRDWAALEAKWREENDAE